jgi:uncharacterized membrane protein
MTTRLASIDLLRTIAIVTMVLVHFSENLSGYTPPLAGLGAPLFVFLSGTSYFLWSDALVARDLSDDAIARVSVRRGLFIFGAGFAFNLFVWLPEDIFDWDVLTFIGSALVMLAFMRRLPREVLVLVAAVSLLVAPILRGMAGYAEYWENGYFECDLTLSDVLVGYLATGYFPLLPWITLSLAGYATASWLFSRRAGGSGPGADPLRIAAIGMGLVAVSAVLLLARPFLAGPVAAGMLGGWTMFPPTTEYVTGMLGVAMASLALGHRFVDPIAASGRLAGAFGVARTFSQYSLTIYVVHHVVHLWPLWIYGFTATGEPAAYWMLALPAGMSLALGGGFLVACFLVLRTIGSRRTFGFEALMRWVCG